MAKLKKGTIVYYIGFEETSADGFKLDIYTYLVTANRKSLTYVRPVLAGRICWDKEFLETFRDFAESSFWASPEEAYKSELANVQLTLTENETEERAGYKLEDWQVAGYKKVVAALKSRLTKLKKSKT